MIKLGALVDLKPLHEAESDKYTHIGYGKYKEKGKEDDDNAPTFEKDGEKFVPISTHKAAAKKDADKDTKKVNIFNKDKEEPNSDKSSEPDYDKYTNKSQTMTDFFKGDLSIDGLQKVAKKNFDSEIATEKDLDGFLNNKFMQDVMADEHGVDRETLVSKVKDLKTSLFGGDKEEPKSEPKTSNSFDIDVDDLDDFSDIDDIIKNHSSKLSKQQIDKLEQLSAEWEDAEGEMAMFGDDDEYEETVSSIKSELEDVLKSDSSSEPQVKPRPADKVLTKTVDKFSKKLGLSPEKLGKEEYEKRMLSYVHDALEDANFHSSNRQIFADLQGRPELAKRPDYSKAPEFGTPEREEWEEKNSIYNKSFDASVSEFDDSDEAVGELTSQAGWEGEKIIDALLNKLRKDGSGELADKIQTSFDKDMAKNESSTKLKDLV